MVHSRAPLHVFFAVGCNLLSLTRCFLLELLKQHFNCFEQSVYMASLEASMTELAARLPMPASWRSLARDTDMDVASVAKHLDEAGEKLSQPPQRTWRARTAANQRKLRATVERRSVC